MSSKLEDSRILITIEFFQKIIGVPDWLSNSKSKKSKKDVRPSALICVLDRDIAEDTSGQDLRNLRWQCRLTIAQHCKYHIQALADLNHSKSIDAVGKVLSWIPHGPVKAKTVHFWEVNHREIRPKDDHDNIVQNANQISKLVLMRLRFFDSLFHIFIVKFLYIIIDKPNNPHPDGSNN